MTTEDTRGLKVEFDEDPALYRERYWVKLSPAQKAEVARIKAELEAYYNHPPVPVYRGYEITHSDAVLYGPWEKARHVCWQGASLDNCDEELVLGSTPDDVREGIDFRLDD